MTSMTSSSTSVISSTALKGRWQTLAPREKNLVLAAAALVALALLWWLALAPALATLRTAPARHAALDTQLQRMHSLQAEAQQLQAAPKTGPGDTVGALRTALAQRLGSTAQLNVVGDRATVTLKGAPADALAQWLTQARSNARATPLEARLVRSTAPAPSPAPATSPALGPSSVPLGAKAAAPVTTVGNAPAALPRWDGTLVLALPAAPAR